MKLVILDRDGVINQDSVHYIKSPAEWKPLPGSLEAIARLNQAGYRVVVATNQSGVGRGLFDMDTLNAIHEKMHRAVQAVGGRIDAIFYCPHAPDANCDCRKPRPGMFERIAACFNIDLARVHAVQDSIKVEQAATGTYEAVDWDKTSLDAARNALLDLGALGNAGFGTPMGTKEQIDPIAHLVSTAAGWGLNPPTEAVYKMVTPAQNDGTTPHQVVMKDIPVDAFWSVSVYDKDGFFAPNSLNVNALNSVSAKAAADGSQTIRFGGCDAGVENCIPITEGWNYTLRLYRPHAEVIDGSWTAPVAEVVK